jgi:hypothetical protein
MHAHICTFMNKDVQSAPQRTTVFQTFACGWRVHESILMCWYLRESKCMCTQEHAYTHYVKARSRPGPGQGHDDGHGHGHGHVPAKVMMMVTVTVTVTSRPRS